jgi:hypothetical protein
MAMLIAAALIVALAGTATGDLCVAENDITGRGGEDPPPQGDLVRVNASGHGRRVVASAGLQDPVWVVSDATDTHAYVGLFHAGHVVRVELATGATQTVATGLSCPEGVGLDGRGNLFVVENPVGDECKGVNLTKSARLTKVDLSSGVKTTVAPLLSPHGMDVKCGGGGGDDEGGGTSSSAEAGGCFAYVCEWGAHAVTRIGLTTGKKTVVGPVKSPSGCAVDVEGGYAYAIEQGETDGQLLRLGLSGEKKPPFVLAKDLAGPMGVAVGEGYVYVAERIKNQIRRIRLSDGQGAAEVWAGGFKSPIGLAVC